MIINEFNKKLTSSQLVENIQKIFGMTVALEKYDREQLEDMRNKLRTRIFQYEGSSGINDLLTNEAYQKDKAMLELLNTRIKEMLGEDIKKLRDKLQQIEEAKKGVRSPKFMKKAKGSKGSDQDGDGTPGEFDDVQVARMTAGGVPKKKAIAKATSDSFKEGFDDMQADVEKRAEQDKQKKGTGKFDVKKTDKGTKYTRKASTFTDGGVDKDVKKAQKESAEKECNHTPKGKSCPVHGLKECGAMKEAKKAKEPFAVGMAAAKKEAGIKKTPAKDLPKSVVKKGHEIGKSIKKTQKESINSYRRNVSIVNESLGYLLAEDEEEKANVITAAGDMANDFTSWMQRVGQYQTKVMIELADEIRHNFGAAEAEAFKQAVGPALSTTLDTLTTQREALSNAIATLAGGAAPVAPMGAEPTVPEPAMEPAAPDVMNEPEVGGDEFAAADAAAGAGAQGREMRESRTSTKLRKLAEAHSIISKLAK